MAIITLLAVFLQTIKYFLKNEIKGTNDSSSKAIIGIKCLVSSLKKYHFQLAEDIHASKPLKTLFIVILNKLKDYLKRTNWSVIDLVSFMLNFKYKCDSI